MEAPVNIISKYLDGDISAKETAALSDWRQSAAENETYFQEMAYLWSKTKDSLSQQPATLAIDTEAALQKLHQKMNDAPVVKMPARRNYLAIAASVSILIAAAFLLRQYVGTASPTQIIASADAGQTVTLPDGSTVWMEPLSELSYDPAFADGRDIHTSGEVFVDVVRDESQPFTVHTPHLTVGVLGTSFVINDGANLTEATVTVLTGKVSVTDKATNKNVTLTKDMTAEYNQQAASLNIGDTARDINHLYDATGELVFVNATLEDMVSRLEALTNNKITLQNEALKDCLFKGHFKTKDLETILQSIQPIYHFTYISKNGQYIIDNGYCNK